VTGVLAHREQIDKTIENTAPAFPLDQVAVIDRNILRLAIYEILIDNRVPMRAAINEAVELAKDFGGENSSRFINGVLGSVSVLTTR
jgi:N utilization substance protein B